MKKNIENILNDFAKKRKIFSNEKQFQFELARELAIKLGGNFEVELEFLACKTKTLPTGVPEEKLYTDIVVFDKNNKYYYPIELKYKTSEYEDSTNFIFLKEQGAENEGKYDFWWDVNRLEILKNKTKGYDFHPKLSTCKFKKGFSIFLTNDGKYWDLTRNRTSAGCFAFSIFKGRCVSGTMAWDLIKTRSIQGTWRETDICLTNKYTCKWKQYIKESPQKNSEFKYLILKV